ncbi:hypothetical protein ACFOEY_16320 [Paracandidimonas soli]
MPPCNGGGSYGRNSRIGKAWPGREATLAPGGARVRRCRAG